MGLILSKCLSRLSYVLALEMFQINEIRAVKPEVIALSLLGG